MWILLAFFGAVSLYGFLSCLLFRLKYDLHKIPSPPLNPILGHLLHFTKMERLTYNDWVLQWYKKLGKPKVMKRVFPGETTLFVFDMEVLKHAVLGRDGLPKSNRFYGLMNVGHTGDPNKMVIFTTPTLTPYYREVRRAATAAFSSSNLRATLPALQRVLTEALEIIGEQRKHGPMDLQIFMVKMTLDVIGACGFDQDFGGMDGTGKIPGMLEEAFRVFEDQIFKPHWEVYMKLFPNSKRARHKKRVIDNLVTEWKKITENIMVRPCPDEKNCELWANLRKMVHPGTNEPYAVSEIFGDVASLLIAGMDTTAHQLQWIFAILSDYPDVVEKMLDELHSHQLYGPNARELVFEDLAELKYMNAVIKECLRILTSTVGFGVREANRDMTLCGYRIPKGTQIAAPSNVYPHLEEYFENPQAFIPERWLPGGKGGEYYPFSTGPRDCAGQKLAWFEMQVTLIRFYSKYTFTLTEGTYEDVKTKRQYDSIVVSADGGLWFNIEERPLNDC